MKRNKMINIKKICDELGISVSAYYARKKRGWSDFEVINTVKIGACYRTKDGTSIYSYLKKLGLEYHSFTNRLAKGVPLEKALEDTLKYKQTNAVYFKDGMTLRQYCIKNGLNYYKEWTKVRKEPN